MSGPKAKAQPQRAPREHHTHVRLKHGKTLLIMRPESTEKDRHALLRQLQKALALAKAIRIAADYPDDGLDIADAVAGLVIVLEGATVLLDPPRSAP